MIFCISGVAILKVSPINSPIYRPSYKVAYIIAHNSSCKKNGTNRSRSRDLIELLTTAAGVNFSRLWKKQTNFSLIRPELSSRHEPDAWVRSYLRGVNFGVMKIMHEYNGMSRGVRPVGCAEKNFPPGRWTCAVETLICSGKKKKFLEWKHSRQTQERRKRRKIYIRFEEHIIDVYINIMYKIQIYIQKNIRQLDINDLDIVYIYIYI